MVPFPVHWKSLIDLKKSATLHFFKKERYRNMIRLNERDILTFKMLNKFRVLNSDLICFFCGFPSYLTVIRRLRLLCKQGYISKYRKDIYHEYVYFLTRKGINQIHMPKVSKNGRLVYPEPSKIVYSNIRHELIIATVVKRILETNTDCTIDDIELDREIRPKEFIKSKRTHIPDIRIKKYRFICEIELHYKRPSELVKNIASNHFYYQLWIIPTGKKKLKERINHQAKFEINTSIEVITLDQIEQFSFNLKQMQETLFNENEDLKSRIEKKISNQIELFEK